MDDRYDFEPQRAHANLRLGVVTFIAATAALIVGPDIAASMMDEPTPSIQRQDWSSSGAPDIERDFDLPFGVADKIAETSPRNRKHKTSWNKAKATPTA